MKIDVSKALNSKGIKFPFEICGKILYNDERINFNNPFNVSGEYSFNGNCIILTGSIAGVLSYNCDRCGDENTVEINLKLNERVFPSQTEDCDYTFENGVIDLDDLVFHNVLLSLPMQLLCKEDCKGVCLGCYANLNYENCKCQ